MPRPWVVNAGDGRLATPRRPFFFLVGYGLFPIAILLSVMKPRHFLVLDRDSRRGDELVALLRGADHEAVAPPTTAAAAEAMSTAEFDALLLDLSLPDLDLPTLRRAISPTESGEPESLAAAERRHLALVLRHTSGNKRKAAHLLGISRSTLLNKVRKYGLEGR
jgi:DNA-binding NtrC family response regulator